VRAGIQIEGSGAVQASARVTWVMVPEFGGTQPILEASGSATNPSTGAAVLGAVEVFTTGHVAIAASSTGSGAVQLQTSDDGTTWFDVTGASIALTGTNTGTISSDQVLRYVQVVAASPGITGDVVVNLVARAR
jgi:hypothetical protein